MADTSPQPEEPRRGGRARKQVERFDASSAPANKGKKRQTEDDDDDDEDSSEEESDVDDPTPTRRKRQSNGAPKKPRTSMAGGASAKRKRKSGAIGAAAVVDDGQTGDGPEGHKTDSSLFNALLSADIALQPLIDDWIETYQQTEGDEVSEQASIYELVLFFIRCCGLSSDIEQAEATDEDGVNDAVERIQDESVKVAAVYPLISRIKTFRPFRNNLNTFITNFINSLSLTPILFYTREDSPYAAPSPLLSTLLIWLNVMSSSPLRPIRHTSTYITLKINSALCDVGTSASKDLSLKQRQKEAEAKKAGPSAAAKKRVADAAARVHEAQQRKDRIEEFLQEIFDVMFVHRVRDADPAIRTDCLRELGVWAKKYPEFYVSTSFLTYFTRGCNDANSHARLETAKALAGLYAKESFVNNARTVTTRLAPRLIEMALRDVDLSVRVTALNAITCIDKTGILQDEDEGQREKVARLVFDQEPRVRKAVGGFILNVWEERKETLKTAWSGARAAKKKRAAKISEEDMAARLDWKALAGLLLETSNSLDNPKEVGTSRQTTILPTSATGSLTRAVAAVESLSAEYELWRDWEGLVDYLLLDHSTANEDMWLLSEEEETLMLQILIAIIQKENKDEDEEDRTKTLIKILPRLFAKHQADVGRMAGILSILGHMNLGLYLDFRMSTAYDSLWDDVTKQFLQHTDLTVLTAAIQAISHLARNVSMSTANSTKLAELQESLFASLRDTIGSEDVALLSMEEDQLAKLEAILLRISLLERSRDIVEVMEDEEDGHSSGWEIVCAFAERGRLGYKEEAKMIEYAVQIVFLHITWLFKRFTAEDAKDDERTNALQEKRDKAVEIFHDLTLGDNNNTADLVRRQAFIAFINLHVLFSSRASNSAPAAKAAPLEVQDEAQHRLGGAFQAAVERFAAEREFENDADASDDESRAPRANRRVGAGTEGETSSASKVQGEFLFLQLVSVFVGAIRCGVLEVDHAKEPLAHYGRFGLTYDAVVKKLVDVLRDEGIYNKEAETVQNIAGTALQQSFNIFLDTDDEEPVGPITLAKLISTAFVIHGNHFSVLRQIHPSDVCDFHVLAVDFISKRITQFVKQERSSKNKDQKARLQKKRFQALTYFKVIVLLLGPVTSSDAAKIKAHLDDAIQALGIDITANKGWEPYRVYEKRIKAIAEKDPNVKLAMNKKQVADTDNDEEEREGTPTPANRRANGAAGSDSLGNGRSSPLSPPPDDEEGDEEERMELDNGNNSRKNERPREEANDEDEEIRVEIQNEDGSEGDLDFDLDLPPAPEMQFDLSMNVDEEGDEEENGDDIPKIYGASQRSRSPSLQPETKKRKTKRY